MGIFIAMSLCAGGYLLYDRGRPAPLPMAKLYEECVSAHVVRVFPR
jgi:hypothetical protein